MARRTIPTAQLQSFLGLDDDELPYAVEITDDGITIDIADADERPPQATIAGYRMNRYTCKAIYRPEENDILLTHAGPSIRRSVSLDGFADMATRDRLQSDLQYERVQAYTNREWDRHTCEECGRLLTDTERKRLRVVLKDKGEKITGPRCEAHQITLYGVMEWNPWEDPDRHTPGGDNSFTAEEYRAIMEDNE